MVVSLPAGFCSTLTKVNTIKIELGLSEQKLRALIFLYCVCKQQLFSDPPNLKRCNHVVSSFKKTTCINMGLCLDVPPNFMVIGMHLYKCVEIGVAYWK